MFVSIGALVPVILGRACPEEWSRERGGTWREEDFKAKGPFIKYSRFTNTVTDGFEVNARVNREMIFLHIQMFDTADLNHLMSFVHTV
jgi:hypothetical protein